MEMQTVKSMVRAAFKQLRREGYAARMNFSCCGSCGSYELSEVVKERGLNGYVFWNRQTNDAFDGEELKSSLWLAWDGDATVIVKALRDAGLNVEHDGEASRCIEVKPN